MTQRLRSARAHSGTKVHAPKLHVDALVALVLLLHILEEEVERLRGAHLARGRKLLR